MTHLRAALALAAAVFAAPVSSQEPAAVAAPVDKRILVPAGTVVDLVTTNALSSKKSVKGDLLYLKVAEPVLIGGVAAIPEGTVVVAQLTRADPRGALGRSGKLDLALLYAELPGGTVRMSGSLGVRGKKDAGDGAATALAFLALPFIATGRSAEIPAGSEVSGRLDRDLWVVPR